MGNFKDLVKSDKHNKTRFIINYILTPIWFFIFFVCLTMILIFMTSADKDDYLIVSIILAAVIVVLIVGAMIGMPLLKKKELNEEIQRYDFDEYDKVVDCGSYNFFYNMVNLSTNEESNTHLLDNGEIIEFNRSGVVLQDKLVPYDDLVFFISTSNKLGRVKVTVQFSIDGKNMIEILLNKEMAFVLKNYNVQLEDDGDLDYLLNNKAEAIKEIYNTGFLYNHKADINGVSNV